MVSITSDVIELVDAALSADYGRVRRAASQIARSLGDDEAAKVILSLIRRKGVPLRASGYMETLPIDSKSRLPLIEEQPWPSIPLFFDEKTKEIVSSFVSDARNVDVLSSKGLSSRLSLLVSGPPGTGKTLLAGHIAAQLQRRLYVVRLDSVISSLLGDTAKNLRNLFEFVPSRDGVLFLDEVDAVAKIRDDKHELGELKRVVNTLIQGLDGLDDHAVVVAATNHPHLLDEAIFRRFPYRLELGLPTEEVRGDLWRHFLFEDEPGGALPTLLARISDGLTGASIQEVALSARRHAALAGRPIESSAVVWAVLQSKNGRLVLPERNGLSSEQKRHLAKELVARGAASGAEVARLLSVSRQAVSAYLRRG